MKLSEMVNEIEKNEATKLKFVENCIKTFNKKTIEESKQINVRIETKEMEWWDTIEYNNKNESLEMHDLITTLGIKEYNVKRVTELLIQGYPSSEIIKKLHIGLNTFNKIKQTIYEKVKEAKQDKKL